LDESNLEGVFFNDGDQQGVKCLIRIRPSFQILNLRWMDWICFCIRK